MKKDFFYYTTLNYNHETDYTYDNAYRLTGFDVDGTSSTTYDRTFTYDRNGNRQKRNSDNYLYGWEQSEDTGLNQLKSAHSKTYTYDANGNIATFDGNTFAYDYRNLCTGVTGSVARTYSYDASGRRVKETDGSTHYYIYDGNTLIAEYTGSTLTAKYIYGNGKILKVDGNGIEWYYMNDHLGSRRVLYSSQGEIGDDYYPFGEIMQHQGNENGYNKFTGKRRDDALGMDHFFARDYLPQTSRFNGSDPVMEYSNPYSYVANRPMNFVDPLGMRSQRNNAGGDSEVYPRGGLFRSFDVYEYAYGKDADGNDVFLQINYSGTAINNPYPYGGNYVASPADVYSTSEEWKTYKKNRARRSTMPQSVGVGGIGLLPNDNPEPQPGTIASAGAYIGYKKIVDGVLSSLPSNLFLSWYIGPNNPIGYTKTPTSLVDLWAMFHDIDFDALRIRGFSGAYGSGEAIPADMLFMKRLISTAFNPYTSGFTRMQAFGTTLGYGVIAMPKLSLYNYNSLISDYYRYNLNYSEIYLPSKD